MLTLLTVIFSRSVCLHRDVLYVLLLGLFEFCYLSFVGIFVTIISLVWCVFYSWNLYVYFVCWFWCCCLMLLLYFFDFCFIMLFSCVMLLSLCCVEFCSNVWYLWFMLMFFLGVLLVICIFFCLYAFMCVCVCDVIFKLSRFNSWFPLITKGLFVIGYLFVNFCVKNFCVFWMFNLALCML